jgi:hypothetical protein
MQIIQASNVSHAEKALLESLFSGNVGVGAVQQLGVGAQELGAGGARTTILTLNAMPMTLLDAQNGVGVKLYTFPKCKLVRLGAVAKGMVITTTSAIASIPA